MIEVAPNLHVGSQADYEGSTFGSDWRFLLAAKYPWHRDALGYTTPAAPRDHHEYLFCYRDGNLILNMIDADNPKFVPEPLVDEAIRFLRERTGPTLVACNQGLSRSATLAFLALAPTLHEDFLTAEEQFNQLYPAYSPAKGVRGYAQAHWERYHAAA